MSADERVLCVGTLFLDEILGRNRTNEEKLASMLIHGTYIPRSQCETDPSYQQLIPYVLVFDERGQILSYNRGDKGGENRLGGKWSCGFGGHVNDKDDGWLGGIVRELREELCFTAAIVPPETLFGVGDWAVLSDPLGFLRSDLTAVDRVHLGVLYTLDVPDVDSVKMVECADWAWKAPDLIDVSKLENWSRMALGMLEGGAS